MGEGTIDPKACAKSTFSSFSLPNRSFSAVPRLEDALHKVLSNLFPKLEVTSNPRAEFYEKFQQAADNHDGDFVKRYDGDMDTTLIFVSIFPHTPRPLYKFYANLKGIGRFVLCRHIRIHPRHSKQFRTGLPRNESYPPQDRR